MENAESLTKQKQTYLRQEIIEKKYDAGAFVEFLAQIKPEGEDLDNWTMEELTDLVTKFQVSNPPNPMTEDIDLNESQDEDAIRTTATGSQGGNQDLAHHAVESSESVPDGLAQALSNSQDTSDLATPQGEPQVETIKQSGGVISHVYTGIRTQIQTETKGLFERAEWRKAAPYQDP